MQMLKLGMKLSMKLENKLIDLRIAPDVKMCMFDPREGLYDTIEKALKDLANRGYTEATQ